QNHHPNTMIRDTSAQDKIIKPAANARKKQLLLWGGGAAIAIVAVTLLLSAWRGSSQSVSGARLRIATVTHGTLVRDASVNGKVVAAISPTLYSTAVGTVTLKVN